MHVSRTAAGTETREGRGILVRVLRFREEQAVRKIRILWLVAAALVPSLGLAGTAAAMPEEKGAAAPPAVTGEIVAVGAEARLVTVKGEKADATFAWDDATRFYPRGKGAADLKVGARVTVLYKAAAGEKRLATKVFFRNLPLHPVERKGTGTPG